jgi:DNA mismatch repair ATPase MutS
MLEQYKKRADAAQKQGQKLRKQSDQLAWMRLASFIIGIGIFVFCCNFGLPYALGFVILFLIGFNRFVAYHQNIESQATHYEQLSAINNREIQFLNHDIQGFEDGAEFQHPEHPYSVDLDIFGTYSFFQYLNRTSTAMGRKRLAAILLYPATHQEIGLRQAAIAELSAKMDWRHDFLARGMNTNDNLSHREALEKWLAQAPIIKGNRFLELSLWLAPLVFLAIIGLITYTGISSLSVLFFVYPAIVNRLVLEKINEAHRQVSKNKDILEKYSKLIQCIENEDFTSEKLINLKQNLSTQNTNATAAMQRLAGLSSQLDTRLNMLTVVLQLSVLWDSQWIFRLDNWKAEHGKSILKWLETLQEMDALISLGSTFANNPDWTFPHINSDANIKAIEMGHPLIHSSKRICNDFGMPSQGHLKLLTGSNMAGKSTFLRTIGSNLFLASIGMPTCTKSLQTPVLQVFTSMRTNDALGESTSSFYAELKRLKTIIEATEQRQDIFFLLDEILKGTNSNDRHSGSKALITQLIESKGAGIVATHDLELGVMEALSHGTIENICMEVDIINDKLSFDYKLKKGVSKSFNATYLMRGMGIKV